MALATAAQMTLVWVFAIYLIRKTKVWTQTLFFKQSTYFVSVIKRLFLVSSPLSFFLAQHCWFEGENGSGKSSLLRLLTGLSTPAFGNVLWQGQSIYQSFTEYREQVGYLGHTQGIKLGLTVRENLSLIQFINQQESVIEDLQLSHYLDTQTKFLSAGQKESWVFGKITHASQAV